VTGTISISHTLTSQLLLTPFRLVSIQETVLWKLQYMFYCTPSFAVQLLPELRFFISTQTSCLSRHDHPTPIRPHHTPRRIPISNHAQKALRHILRLPRPSRRQFLPIALHHLRTLLVAHAPQRRFNNAGRNTIDLGDRQRAIQQEPRTEWQLTRMGFMSNARLRTMECRPPA